MDTTNLWYGNYTFTEGITMLIVDIFLYMAIGLYLDQVIQTEYGVAKPWNFLCTKKYWCEKKRKRKTIDEH